ncbi:MAG: hypothetical protein DYG89_18080 [Caldilinea sp. CFX5]|nr:hypothetical protein [Caldilinea sp. CFX5]
MVRINRLFTILLLAALILSACQPITQPPPPTVQPPHGLRPDAPTYGQRGPYAVGVRELVVKATKAGERPLQVMVWYPALKPEGVAEIVTYPMDFLASPTTGFSTGGCALHNAAPDPANKPYPLVLYSHGAWCFPAIAGFFTEHLASHGFVVMAPVHEDNWGTLFQCTYKSEISRPRDLVRLLDFAETVTARPGEWAGLIDMTHVAAAGHSMGGKTALALGGARLNLTEWQAGFCQAYPQDNDCKYYPAHLAEMASLAGLDAVPAGLWPDWRDPRIDVVVASAPAVSLFGNNGLAGMKRPVMLLYGTKDSIVGAALAYQQPYKQLPGPDKTRVLFENADHMIFGNACAACPGMVGAGFYYTCSDAVWDMNRAHDLINHFVTAFLLAELKGDSAAAEALAPANVTFPGIRYETTEFSQ